MGEGEDAIQAFFDDHAAIQALGLRSVINVPVVLDGACLGTLNFLMPRPAVSASNLHTARLLGLVALPALRALCAGHERGRDTRPHPRYTKALRIRAEVMSITTTKATMMIMTAQVSA